MSSMSLQGTRVLVIGASGLLGQAMGRALETRGAVVFGSSARKKQNAYHFLNVRIPESIETVLESTQPDLVINCSGYTAVDLAESEYVAAFAINAEGVRSLAESCVRRGIFLAHISTDYVFGGGVFGEGMEPAPYKEDDPSAPLGIYGLSKWYGELFVRGVAAERSLIVRTSWLHGRFGSNFLDTMLHLSGKLKQVKVVDDQVGSLTWAPWLADCLCRLLEHQVTGTVHVSSQGAVSWYEVAQELFAQAGVAIEVLPVSTEEFPRPAPRPAYSALDTSKLRELIQIPDFTWSDSIAKHLADRPAATS